LPGVVGRSAAVGRRPLRQDERRRHRELTLDDTLIGLLETKGAATKADHGGPA
jgi:hypothetical protein